MQAGNITVVVEKVISNNGGFSAVDIPSLCVSLIAIFIALGSYLLALKAYGVQSFEEYFKINKFIMDEWEDIAPFTPLGKCKDKKEAKIRLFLYHELNRFNLETEKSKRKLHKKFSKAMYGNSIQDFKDKLKYRDATDETADLAADILRRIRNKDPYFSDKFWEKFFGPNYFDEKSSTSVGTDAPT
jgi:hypothetical protein